MAEDFYSILGVDRKATSEQIKKAYRSLARKHHPDRNQGKKDAEERFKRISAAYAVLGDGKKRKLYDQYGVDGLRDGFDPEMWSRYGQAGAGGGGRGGQAEGFDFGGFSGFGSMEDVFESLFGGGMGRRGKGRTRIKWGGGPQQGAQIRSVIDVELLDAVLGRELEIALDAGGEAKRLKVKIPAGIEDGQTIRLGGQGGKGSGGGTAGDLLLEVRVKGDPVYARSGNDLERRTMITMGTAYEGGEIEVETPWGKGRLRIPPGTQGGTRFRLKGQGIRKKGVSGDLLVRTDIRIPGTRDEETAALVRKIESKYDK